VSGAIATSGVTGLRCRTLHQVLLVGLGVSCKNSSIWSGLKCFTTCLIITSRSRGSSFTVDDMGHFRADHGMRKRFGRLPSFVLLFLRSASSSNQIVAGLGPLGQLKTGVLGAMEDQEVQAERRRMMAKLAGLVDGAGSGTRNSFN